MPNAPHKHPQYGLRIPAETMDKLKYIASNASNKLATKRYTKITRIRVITYS